MLIEAWVNLTVTFLAFCIVSYSFNGFGLQLMNYKDDVDLKTKAITAASVFPLSQLYSTIKHCQAI